MTKTKQRFNEYMTKRELKRRFLINDKFIGRFFPTPVKISTSKNSNKLRDAWPVSVVEEIMQRKKFQHDHYSTRGSEPNAKKRKTVRKALIRTSSINTCLNPCQTQAEILFFTSALPTAVKPITP